MYVAFHPQFHLSKNWQFILQIDFHIQNDVYKSIHPSTVCNSKGLEAAHIAIDKKWKLHYTHKLEHSAAVCVQIWKDLQDTPLNAKIQKNVYILLPFV
jgi:hypothetical protein